MANENQEVKEPKANLAMTTRGFEPTDIESAYRYAKVISLSDFATPMYKGNEANCLILIDVALRMEVPWLMLMQHMYIVHERPALDSTISTALVNKSGEFVDPIEYEADGKDARDKDYRVRAYATRKSTGTVLYGPWIDWPLVRGEGWDAKAGSKWKTMPDQMFHYRAASWFQRRYCPELTMGMMTPEEAFEAPRKKVDSTAVDLNKPTTERILDHSTDASKKVDEAEAETEKPTEKPPRKPRSDKGTTRGKKSEQAQEPTPETTQEPETKTEKEEPKLVKCPICEKEVDPSKHDCNRPETEQPTEDTPTTVGKDTHKCLRCERKFPKPTTDNCPFCMGKIVELK